MHLRTNGQVSMLCKQVAWLLGGEVEVTWHSTDDGLHLVCKDLDYDMSGEIYKTNEEDE
jgi:hypothetical protein